MLYELIRDKNERYIKQAADLHFKELSYRSFITSFGKEFLYQLYISILMHRIGFIIAATENAQLKGFVLGCTDSTRLMSVIYKRFWVFSRLIVPQIFKNPALVVKLFETFFYSKKENIEIKAELLVIAVDDKFKSRGIGSTLFKKLNDEFTKRGISEFKVTVHEQMEKSNNFYIKNGMTLYKTFTLYSMLWNLYINNTSSKTIMKNNEI